MSYTIEKPEPVLVGLSGGVDSSVCIQILKEQALKPEAVVIAFSPEHEAAVEAATRAAHELQVPLDVIHAEDRFEAEVVEPFCDTYAAGQTPNPCVVCNPLVKFRILAEEADRRGITLIATGHYARVEERDGVCYIAQAESKERDQSYMLYRLPQDILKRLVLPVGEFAKDDIREMAKDAELTCADAPDSQEICFIPDGDYPAFMAARGHKGKPGRFIGPDGEDLGGHKGVEHYTIGQRKGLGLALGEPVFVKAITTEGDIQLGWAGEEFSSAVTLRDTVFAAEAPKAGAQLQVKVRSAARPAPCTVEYNKGGALVLRFAEPQRAPAPGQSAVLYSGELVLGGGIIDEAHA